MRVREGTVRGAQTSGSLTSVLTSSGGRLSLLWRTTFSFMEGSQSLPRVLPPPAGCPLDREKMILWSGPRILVVCLDKWPRLCWKGGVSSLSPWADTVGTRSWPRVLEGYKSQSLYRICRVWEIANQRQIWLIPLEKKLLSVLTERCIYCINYEKCHRGKYRYHSKVLKLAPGK